LPMIPPGAMRGNGFIHSALSRNPLTLRHRFSTRLRSPVL
jgi:hypothetical protein